METAKTWNLVYDSGASPANKLEQQNSGIPGGLRLGFAGARVKLPDQIGRKSDEIERLARRSKNPKLNPHQEPNNSTTKVAPRKRTKKRSFFFFSTPDSPRNEQRKTTISSWENNATQQQQKIKTENISTNLDGGRRRTRTLAKSLESFRARSLLESRLEPKEPEGGPHWSRTPVASRRIEAAGGGGA